MLAFEEKVFHFKATREREKKGNKNWWFQYVEERKSLNILRFHRSNEQLIGEGWERCVWYDRELWDWLQWKMIFCLTCTSVSQGRLLRIKGIFFSENKFYLFHNKTSHNHTEMLLLNTRSSPAFVFPEYIENFLPT